MEGCRGEDFRDIRGIDGRTEGEGPELYCLECNKQHTTHDYGCGVDIGSVERVGGVILRGLTCESALLEEKGGSGKSSLYVMLVMAVGTTGVSVPCEAWDSSSVQRQGDTNERKTSRWTISLSGTRDCKGSYSCGV